MDEITLVQEGDQLFIQVVPGGTGGGAPGPPGPQGEPGADGRTVLNGNSAPASGTGNVGDFFIDTAAWRIYGPKTTGGWGTGTGLQGAAGTNGRTILSGAGTPSGSLGSVGDFYLDTTATRLHGPKASGGWGSGVALIGAQGPEGPAGPTGPAGPQGPAGSYNPRGEYSDAVTYQLNDSVFHTPTGSSYYATGATTGVEPPDAPWQYLARGTAGANLGDLLDVDTAGAASGHAPVFNGTLWTPTNVATQAELDAHAAAGHGGGASINKLDDVADVDVTAVGTNEQQSVAITGSPTGGTFTLALTAKESTQTTTGIAHNATAAAVQTALEALSNVDVGDVAVTGGPLPGTAVTVEFTGTLARQPIGAMVANSALLTGGTTPTATATVTVAGIYVPDQSVLRRDETNNLWVAQKLLFTSSDATVNVNDDAAGTIDLTLEEAGYDGEGTYQRGSVSQATFDAAHDAFQGRPSSQIIISSHADGIPPAGVWADPYLLMYDGTFGRFALTMGVAIESGGNPMTVQLYLNTSAGGQTAMFVTPLTCPAGTRVGAFVVPSAALFAAGDFITGEVLGPVPATGARPAVQGTAFYDGQ